ncbi:MAG: class F sortase [Actinomycetales bacterium]|nr:class F sortase [Actinomycetales bacterium]
MKLRPRPAEVVSALVSLMLLIAVVLTLAGSQAAMTSAEPAPFGSRQTAIAARESAKLSEKIYVNSEIPVRLQIPALDISARILPVGTDRQRNVAVPKSIEDVGWYRYGVSAGTAQGSTVLVAHRDGRIGGQGVFYDLGQLQRNDRIIVTDSGRRHWEYRVVARELVSKSKFAVQAEDFFERTGPHRLTLITCGGAYVRAAGGYQSNVIVTALPVAPESAPSSR